MQLSCACKRWERRCFGRCFLAIRMPICSFVHTRYYTMLHKAICNLLFFFILAWCANGLLWTKASDLFLRSYRQDIWCEKWAANSCARLKRVRETLCHRRRQPLVGEAASPSPWPSKFFHFRLLNRLKIGVEPHPLILKMTGYFPWSLPQEKCLPVPLTYL